MSFHIQPPLCAQFPCPIFTRSQNTLHPCTHCLNPASPTQWQYNHDYSSNCGKENGGDVYSLWSLSCALWPLCTQAEDQVGWRQNPHYAPSQGRSHPDWVIGGRLGTFSKEDHVLQGSLWAAWTHFLQMDVLWALCSPQSQSSRSWGCLYTRAPWMAPVGHLKSWRHSTEIWEEQCFSDFALNLYYLGATFVLTPVHR